MAFQGNFPLVEEYLACSEDHCPIRIGLGRSFGDPMPSKILATVRVVALAAALLADGTVALRGQSALDGFDPNANGVVYVVVVQPDGKILLGGDFTTLSPNGGGPGTSI